GVEWVAGGYGSADVATDGDLGVVGRRGVTRTGVNNQLRSGLRAIIARLRLEDEDPRRRIAAVREVGQSEDPAMIGVLAELLEREENGGVARAIETAIAMLQLDSDDAAVR